MEKLRIIFMGTPEFAVPSLKMLIEQGYDVVGVVTQPDKPKGRGNKLAPPAVKEFAIQHGICVMQPIKVRTDEFPETLKKLSPNLFITAAYGRILTQKVLDIPRFGCINVHGSLLPKYRGASPIQSSIINGEKTTGITTMFTDIEMDTGDILLKDEIEIGEDTNAGELHDRMAVLGAETLKKTLELLTKGELKRTIQNSEEATYCRMFSKEDGRIDWKLSAQKIHDLVRGTNPWPGAFTYIKDSSVVEGSSDKNSRAAKDDTRLRLWKTRIVKDATALATKLNGSGLALDIKEREPGKVLCFSRQGFIVATGDGLIEIMELQLDSSKRMLASDFVLGHKVPEGEILG